MPGDPHGCPFVVTDAGEAARLLDAGSLLDVISRMHSALAGSGRLAASPQVHAYADRAARVHHLLALWERGAVGVLRIPDTYSRDESLRRWLLAYEGYIVLARKEQQEQKVAPLTDTMEDAPQTAVRVFNPRWEHVDEQAKKQRSDAALQRDTVTLLVDVEGISDGADVTFDVYETTQDPPQRIDTVRGRNQQGTARCQWVVPDSSTAATRSLVVRIENPEALADAGSEQFALGRLRHDRSTDVTATVNTSGECRFDGLLAGQAYALLSRSDDGASSPLGALRMPVDAASEKQQTPVKRLIVRVENGDAVGGSPAEKFSLQASGSTDRTTVALSSSSSNKGALDVTFDSVDADALHHLGCSWEEHGIDAGLSSVCPAEWAPSPEPTPFKFEGSARGKTSDKCEVKCVRAMPLVLRIPARMIPADAGADSAEISCEETGFSLSVKLAEFKTAGKFAEYTVAHVAAAKKHDLTITVAKDNAACTLLSDKPLKQENT